MATGHGYGGRVGGFSWSEMWREKAKGKSKKAKYCGGGRRRTGIGCRHRAGLMSKAAGRRDVDVMLLNCRMHWRGEISQAALTEAATVAKVCKIPRTGFSDRLGRHIGMMTWLAGCVRTDGRPARCRGQSRDLKEETFLMPTLNRRAAGRRRAWGRGPIILRFDSLEPRELLTAPPPLADLAGTSLVTTHAADWNDTVGVQGNIVNQGGSTVTVPFEVALYASPSTAIGRYAVPVGEVMIPAGITPGQTVPFNTTIKLPSTPIPGVGNAGVVYIDMKIDPNQAVPQSNRRTNSGLGIPYESSYITITPDQPSDLLGSTLAVSAPTTTWGSTITVTAQIRNAGAGASPPTRPYWR